MKLVTIQTKAAYDSFLKNGYLIANSKFINEAKYGVPYSFIIKNMQNINNNYNAKYPIWAWVKYGGYSSPPKNRLLGFFPKDEDEIVRITFEKKDNQVLVSDYIKYHFLLTNEYLPKSIKDMLDFESLMTSSGVSKEDLLAYVRRDKYTTYRKDDNFKYINKKIALSYEDIFVLGNRILQATVWYITKAEVKKVEIIKRKNCFKKHPIDYRKMYRKQLK